MTSELTVLVLLGVFQELLKVLEHFGAIWSNAPITFLSLMLTQVCLEAGVGGRGDGAVGALVAVADADLVGLLLPCRCLHGAHKSHPFVGPPVLRLLIRHRHLLWQSIVPFWPHFVCCHVFLHIGLLSKSTTTYDTLVGLFACVASCVLCQVKHFVEAFLTIGTEELFTLAHIL